MVLLLFRVLSSKIWSAELESHRLASPQHCTSHVLACLITSQSALALAKQVSSRFAVDNDPDAELVPAVVAQIVAKGCFAPMVRDAWDAGDATQATAVKSTLATLLTFATPQTQQHFEPVIAAVRQGLQSAVDACAVPRWPPAALRVAPRAAVAAAAAWRHAAALLAAVCTFQGLLSRQLVDTLAGGQLLRGQLLPCLEVYVTAGERGSAFAAALALARAAAAAAALPEAWRTSDAAAGGAVGALRQLAARAVRLVGPAAPRRMHDDAAALRAALKL